MPRIARVFNICAIAALFCLFLLKSIDQPAEPRSAASAEHAKPKAPHNILLSTSVSSRPAAPQVAPYLRTVVPTPAEAGNFVEYASTIWFARNEPVPPETEASDVPATPASSALAAEPTATLPATPAPAATGTTPPKPKSTANKESGTYREVWAVVTAYCPCSRCCGRGSPGRTSIGTSAWKPGIAAAPQALSYGTRVYVPGYGLYEVDDTGGAMRRSWRDGRLHIDIRMTYHWQAKEWGNRLMKIRVYKD